MATRKTTKQNTGGIDVSKTYKIFIGGAFPRTESGRYFDVKDKEEKFLANVCLSSRKDFRNAVVAARKAQDSWQDRSAYNRAQIIYRIAEMLQQKRSVFIDEMTSMGHSSSRAQTEFAEAIDLLVYYAGWCDKYQQIYSSVNPVASSHFNFSVPEPMGVVAVMAENGTALTGIVKAMIPAICGGNTVVVLASESYPLCAISLAEVIATSDVPGGVVNILTGKRAELQHHFASHMDVNALVVWDAAVSLQMELGQHGAENVKRGIFYESKETEKPGPLFINDLQEVKTTWHPIEQIKGSGGGY
ncbi:MAG: aldehyde dehydrogenase family protein [Cryomorphaceae bacterium]|nr:aldehyde dehydrogenase family protein [Flavobacteriales bacterium]